MVKAVRKCKSGKCHNENHLCQVILTGDLGRVKEIIKHAKYFCKRCGRSAHSEDNLCDPSKI